MINHVVLLNWGPGVTEKTILTVTNGFVNLAKVIDEIRSYSFGPNLNLEGSNYHYALVATFENMKDFNTYTVHPAHTHFMDTITSPIVASYGAVQYSS
ncbi:MAG: hypothetical protein COA42_06485 [Alteromonadaceae bacterium]|nr:MAG: hypothetical protein COA42_06485 [Alteromonadaceae bacterium]